VSDHVHEGGPTAEALFAYRAGRLHPEAAEWIDEHVRGCVRCRAVLAHIDAVHDALEPPPEPPFMRQADITAVRRRLEHPQPRLHWFAFAALAGGVVGLALVLGLRWAHPNVPAPSQLLAIPDDVSFALAARQGAAEVELGDDRAAAEAKMALPPHGAITVAPSSRVVASWGGARVAVEGGSAGARAQLLASAVHSRQLLLERGRVVLDVDPLAVGAELIIVTRDARVSVHGTRFLVDASPTGTQVAVDRGRVRVALRGRVVDVPAGTQLSPGATAPSGLSAESAAQLSALEAALAGGPTETLDVFADVAGARVAVDGVEYGRVPLSLAAAPGMHLVRVQATGRLPVEERVEVVAGSPTLFRAELPELSGIDDADKRPEHAGPSARALLAQARAEVLAGAYDRAIERLEQLRASHAPKVQLSRASLLEAQALRLEHRPERALSLLAAVARGDGPEAEQAQFLLGQTLARDLHDAAKAAAAYADSERRFAHGIFAAEAAFRRGEALLGAGETRAGIAALDSYLVRFPGAPHADDAHLYVASARRDRLNDCAGALPHLTAVADGKGPRAELALIGAARCLGTLERPAEARGLYARYLLRQPHGRFADEARLGASGSARLGR
jgi:ferric-dicitrate binding protein FerR (iron transport regulator)/outer membrane protein assembly factor BamD (BamD/ComL family)